MKKVTVLFLMLGVLCLTACGVNTNNGNKPVIEVVDEVPPLSGDFQPCYGENRIFVIWITLEDTCANYPYTAEEFNQYVNGEWNEEN